MSRSKITRTEAISDEELQAFVAAGGGQTDFAFARLADDQQALHHFTW